MTFDSAVRLNKFISDSGHCSRREADKLIASDRVKINGLLPELGAVVESGDLVTVDDQPLRASAADKTDRIYIAYNKPFGITCTTDQTVKGNIVDAIDHDERIFPIGRLDKPSEGLILLTSDGDIVNKILRAENAHDKEYIVTVNKNLAPNFAEKMSRGLPILGTITKPCKVRVIGKTTFKIILTQGLNRQIRRMCDYLGYDVKQLVRTRIMNIELGKLKPGQWRRLTKVELDLLTKATSQSSKTAIKGANAKPSASPAATKPRVAKPKVKKEPKDLDKHGRPKNKSTGVKRGAKSKNLTTGGRNGNKGAGRGNAGRLTAPRGRK
ncbi:pseudouridine synthase [Saccharophagus degradans]|uniref:Pseudouridine synthase n=1 Tax=Saccharophagus degradans TaxID=86304 RepID=A0AAW7X6D8_9GAMM|nr:pseudouridine synthase [Saccharophagus degradans]MDO6423134.1 pseudouridine synthase [Saccharophagus degradans]MDO6607342.1 pseudouridine synthase [Saccharophagus degradans]